MAYEELVRQGIGLIDTAEARCYVYKLGVTDRAKVDSMSLTWCSHHSQANLASGLCVIACIHIICMLHCKCHRHPQAGTNRLQTHANHSHPDARARCTALACPRISSAASCSARERSRSSPQSLGPCPGVSPPAPWRRPAGLPALSQGC